VGEDPFDHGFLIWDIETGDVEEINIPNDYVMIKFTINPGQDYDRLKLSSRYVAKYNKFRVDWTDYAANVTNDNENKIRKYLKEKYKPIDIEIKPTRIYTDIKDGKMLSEVININDKQVQQDIMREYLKDNKFESEFIERIIELDNIVNDRLQLSEAKNILWNIDKFWFSNFKSYGDDNEISWDNISGTIQIAGENQQGKTTILDAICFILYGTTLSTTKDEKNGYNRYINKYRDLDYAVGGAIIDINGEKYIMQRRVDREVKKGVIKKVPMTVDYWKGTEMLDENKETGERRTSTQKKLDDVIGDFQDFIRMSLTNADNLNQLLSMDRSVFIDSIVRDAGYDVFEKKLEEFKLYKKEISTDKITINESDVENQIVNIKKDLEDKQEYLSNIENLLEEIEITSKDETTIKEECLRKLHKIDEEILKIDILKVKNSLRRSKENKDNIQIEIESLNESISHLPKIFDNETLEKLSIQLEKYNTEKNRRDIELIKLKNLVTQNEEKIKNVDKDINNEKSKYLEFLRTNIITTKAELRDVINEINSNYKTKENEIINQKNNYKNEIDNLRQNGVSEKDKITSYTNMLNGDNEICPTCNQKIVSRDEEHITMLINESTIKIEDIKNKAKEKISLFNECTTKIETLKTLTDELITKKRNEYDKKIEDIQYRMDNFDVAMIADKISDINRNKEVAEADNLDYSIKIEEREKYLERLNLEIKKIEVKISKLKIDKTLHDQYITSSTQRDKLVIEVKDVKREFEDNKRLLEEYEKNANLIEENKKLDIQIKSSDEILENLKFKKSEHLNNKVSYSNQITLSSKVKEDLEDKLKRYREQQRIEEQHNVYIKLMHRTGLPMYLLTKNIDLLNKELADLLTNTDFTLFFDEDLNLKLKHDGKEGEINAIESSGAERVFSAITLKMVLRIINFKSKPNFMFLDEILNRLVNKSVDKFMELLETLKEKIDKIVIIEHNVEISSDLVISVKKDSNGVSSFELI